MGNAGCASQLIIRGLYSVTSSEEHELLSNVTFDSLGLNSENIESHGLWEWSALSNGNDITFSDSESWWDVDGEVVVSLLESVVLLDVVEIVSSDDDGSLHLGR